MKNDKAIIYVTHNGYVAEVHSRDDYGLPKMHTTTWAFESMAQLQKRLPEILEIPVEKRLAKQK
jgi:hypothetical protein